MALPRAVIICKQCNEPFEVPPHRAEVAMYCSYDCAGLARRGEVHHWVTWPKGKKRGAPSAEHRKRNGDARRGKAMSEEVCQKHSEIARFCFTGGQTGNDFAAVLCPAGFVREHHVCWSRGHNNRYVLDFAHVEGKINIELDGPRHCADKEYDRERDARLKNLGWRVIRIRHE